MNYNYRILTIVGLQEGEKPVVFITHDESTFNCNDGKRQGWMKAGQQPLRPKGRGRGMMVSGFLTPGGRLKVPAHIEDEKLLQDPSWEKDQYGNPIRDAMALHETTKEGYWSGDHMVEQTLRVAFPIFRLAFPGCQALFAFDNASNHCSYANDALRAHRMNLRPGGEQPLMREGFDYGRNLPHTMVFPMNHPTFELRGKAKGTEVVLRERKLWPFQGRRADGARFLHNCPRDHGRKGCKDYVGTELEGRCCATSLLARQPDFQQQKNRLVEELEALHQLAIFYPKFHPELNFIERFWCGAKWYTREHCEYTWESLKQTLPVALDSISTATIHRHYEHCVRTLDAYIEGCTYGTREFTECVYRGHRQVVDKSKW